MANKYDPILGEYRQDDSGGAETDTLATVTSRGSLTLTPVTLAGGLLTTSATITIIPNLNVQGLVKTTGTGGTLGIDTATYLTAEADTLASVMARGATTGVQISSTVTTGTSPLSVASTTVNTNLNADLLDGNHAASFLTSASTLDATKLSGALPAIDGTSLTGVLHSEADTLATVTGRGATTSTASVFSTSVSTPSLITSSGALTITPAAGSNLNITTSTTGDVAVNTSQLYVDASSGNVGVGTATPDTSLSVDTRTGGVSVNFIPDGVGGIDTNTLSILHVDNNVTDSATSFSRTWTNNNATFSNSVGEYKFGYSSVFGGTAYVDTPNAAELNFTTGDFTVDFWMKTTQVAGSFILIKCVSAANDWGYYFRLNATANKLTFAIYDTAERGITSTTSVNDGAWHHVAGVRSGATTKLYIDGVSEGTPYTSTGTLRTSTAKLTVGRLGEASNLYYVGNIDELRISNIARWSANFTPPAGAYDGLSPFASPRIHYKNNGTTKWTIGSDGSDSDKFKIGSTALGTGTALTISGTTTTLGALNLKQGANGKVGTFVCNGTTPVTISNTSVAITDAIIISLNTVGGTVGAIPRLATITAATGFTTVGTAGDTSTYNYCIISNVA
jgi:hypothetical protein